MKPAHSKKAKAIHAGSTQRFTDIDDILEDVVMFQGGSACLIIEVQASNFALLSVQEQEAKIYAYAGMLNSLSFPIQIVIQNKKIDISSYLNLLEDQSKKTAVHTNLSANINQALLTQIKLYKEFVQELVKVNTVLDKRFYVVIPYSYLEKGVVGVATATKGQSGKEAFFETAKAALHTKANSVLGQLARTGLRAKVLSKEELIRLFYEIYNQTQTAPDQLSNSIKQAIIKGQQA